MGTLYIVATPIGNLEDITLRALRTLREATLIAAEDTRVARKLLSYYQIDTPVISFHEHSREPRMFEIIEALNAGDVALISDAGMPGISDPGSKLIAAASSHGFAVIPIPGPSSVTAAAAVSGLADDGFIFIGFLPRRENEKRERINRLVGTGLPLVLYESPARVRQLLELLAELAPAASVVIGREITKLHEEWRRGNPAALLDDLIERGEFTLVVQAVGPSESDEADVDLDRMIADAFAETTSLRDAVDHVIAATGLPRRTVYQRALELQREQAGRLNTPEAW